MDPRVGFESDLILVFPSAELQGHKGSRAWVLEILFHDMEAKN